MTSSVRIALQSLNQSFPEKGEQKKKYEAPKSKKQQRIIENNRTNTAKYFCKYGKLKLPKPIPSRKLSKYVSIKFTVPKWNKQFHMCMKGVKRNLSTLSG